MHVGGQRVIATAEGNGPVNALDRALRNALDGRFPALERVHLTDYKVRVLDTQKGTGAVTRVLIDSTDGDQTWTTIGVNENIIEASWQALLDSIHFGLLRAAVRRAGAPRVSFIACRPIRSCRRSSRDRPRQQQNLPPGLAPPPARDWRADRPGDLGRRQRRGRAAGSARTERRLRVHARRAGPRTRCACRRSSTTDDVIAVVAEIAGKRAAHFGRAPVMADIDVAIALLGYDGLADDDVRRAAVPPRARRRPRLHPPARARRRGSRRRCCGCGCRELLDRVDEWRVAARRLACLGLTPHLRRNGLR